MAPHIAADETDQMSQQYWIGNRAISCGASIDAESVFEVAMVAMSFRYAAPVNKLLIPARVVDAT